MELSEGGVTIEVEQPRDGTREGSGDGVFFNPEMELNRDITVPSSAPTRSGNPALPPIATRWRPPESVASERPTRGTT